MNLGEEFQQDAQTGEKKIGLQDRAPILLRFGYKFDLWAAAPRGIQWDYDRFAEAPRRGKG
eukprot:2376435-Pyramimonas_sp.AAC.1